MTRPKKCLPTFGLKHIATALFPLALLGACVDGPRLPFAPAAQSAPLMAAAADEATRVLHVPRDFPTIQAAVDAARPGDVVLVAAGTYREKVVITTSDLRLRAREGAVLDGAGFTGAGIHVRGTAAQPVVGVEVEGFEVKNFEQGIVVEQAAGARIRRNEVHHNFARNPQMAFIAHGIELRATRDSEISQNFVHHNGTAGIQARLGSTRNVVRANRAHENGTQRMATWEGAGIWVTGPNNHDNEILENEILRNHGWGIVVVRPAGTGPLTGTVIAQNRIHENARAGIAIMGPPAGNFVRQNNATGNSRAGYTLAPCYPFDLFDDLPVDNVWERNQGTSNF